MAKNVNDDSDDDDCSQVPICTMKHGSVQQEVLCKLGRKGSAPRAEPVRLQELLLRRDRLLQPLLCSKGQCLGEALLSQQVEGKGATILICTVAKNNRWSFASRLLPMACEGLDCGTVP